jgi:hypothetical protein
MCRRWTWEDPGFKPGWAQNVVKPKETSKAQLGAQVVHSYNPGNMGDGDRRIVIYSKTLSEH